MSSQQYVKLTLQVSQNIIIVAQVGKNCSLVKRIQSFSRFMPFKSLSFCSIGLAAYAQFCVWLSSISYLKGLNWCSTRNKAAEHNVINAILSKDQYDKVVAVQIKTKLV